MIINSLKDIILVINKGNILCDYLSINKIFILTYIFIPKEKINLINVIRLFLIII